MLKFKDYLLEANICPVCNSEPCSCPGGDNHITESDAAYAAGEAKRKEQEAKKSLTKKDASTVDKIRAMMAKEKMKEEVELEEDMKSAAKEMHGYASNHGGMDKADFHKAAKHMETGNHKALHALIKNLDSDPRDKILTTLHKHGHDIKRYGYSAEEVEEVEEGVQQALRKYVPGYAKHQLNKKMDAQKYAPGDSVKKTVDKDVNFDRYKKIYDKLKKEEVEENYVSHAQRKAVWANRADDGKGHPDNKKKMKKEEMDSDKKETPPFDGPYSKKKVATPGKQGYGMSAARHLARQAMQKVVDKQKNK